MTDIFRNAAFIGTAAILLGTSLTLSSSSPVAASPIQPASKTLVKCDKTTACFEGENSGAGYGLTGLVSGTTGSAGNIEPAGVYGIGDGEFTDGVLGLGFGSLATGVWGLSENGIGGVFETYSSYEPSLDVSSLGTGDLLQGFGSGGAFTIDTDADAIFDGYVEASTFYSSTLARGGGHFAAFSTRSTSNVLEDTGTARLVNGEGAVRFDPALSSVIDASRGYQVFLTPDGDTRGLYVAAKYEGGFIVRETERGRSSLLFDYRVVARPYGTSDARLPRLTITRRRPPSFLKPRIMLPPQP
jgi:hypothetical protein